MVDHFVRYAFLKRGVYYFSKRIPSDMRHLYKVDRISYSLRTNSKITARLHAHNAALELEAYWTTRREEIRPAPGLRFLKSYDSKCMNGTTLREAESLYLKAKSDNRSSSFTKSVNRAIKYLISVAGNKNIKEYRRSDANTFRDSLLNKNLTGTSITRILSTIKAIFNFIKTERGLEFKNPFEHMNYERSQGTKDRNPIPLEIIREIQRKCREKDDELRWLIALLSDTGLRLAEAVGILKEDINLQEPIPYVFIQKHPWRSLKTPQSQRKVPIVGHSLWAAQRILQNQTSSFAFPRYNKGKATNAGSASAALNKWIKREGFGEYTLHGFRHSLRDRLREAECPSDIADQIGGWSTKNVGQGYGNG